MQAHYEPTFEREMGCTEAELRAWLPGASGGAALAFRDDGADVALDSGELRLRWQTLPPRRIALITLPRLRVRFEFVRVDDAERRRFMRHFDLYTQRGGG
ncbi:MAG: hypothetical protein MUE62_05220 [Burkholderiaceae bacterium]|jgi:hypothetical protein|nr:hypothetical protein [Burkholderiaceae bacterium]